MPHDLGTPVQAGPDSFPAAVDAKVEKLLFSFEEPQCGHFVPFQFVERTSTSLSFPQAEQ